MDATGRRTEVCSLADAGSWDAAKGAKARLSRDLLNPASPDFYRFAADESPALRHNVVGVGTGRRRQRGRSTGEICVKVYVRKKFNLAEIPHSERLERTYDGVLVDVEESGIFKELLSDRPMPDPTRQSGSIQPGASISGCGCQGRTFTGTLGAIVVGENGARFGLTNRHVLSRACRHEDVFHPGFADLVVGEPASRLGRYAGGIDPVEGGTNDVDAALSTVECSASRAVMYIGDPTALYNASIGMHVQKFGRTTRYTTGVITSTAVAVKVYSERLDGNLYYEDQIVIEPTFGHERFSASGDSGALILEIDTNRALGLLFAGGSTLGIANHLFRVLDELGMSMAD